MGKASHPAGLHPVADEEAPVTVVNCLATAHYAKTLFDPASLPAAVHAETTFNTASLPAAVQADTNSDVFLDQVSPDLGGQDQVELTFSHAGDAFAPLTAATLPSPTEETEQSPAAVPFCHVPADLCLPLPALAHTAPTEKALASVLECQMATDEVCLPTPASALSVSAPEAPFSVLDYQITADDICLPPLTASVPASPMEAHASGVASTSDSAIGDAHLERGAPALVAAAAAAPKVVPDSQVVADGTSLPIQALSALIPSGETSVSMLDCPRVAVDACLQTPESALSTPAKRTPAGGTCLQLALSESPTAATARSEMKICAGSQTNEQAPRVLSGPKQEAGYTGKVSQTVFQKLSSKLHAHTKPLPSGKSDWKLSMGVKNTNNGMELSAPQQSPHGARSRRATLSSYKALGASPEDSAHDLKKKYRRQLLQKHPDKGGKKEDFLEVQRSLNYVAAKRKSVAMLFGMSRPDGADATETAEDGSSCLDEEPTLGHQPHDDLSGVVSATDVAKVALPVAKRRRQARSCGS